VEANIEFDPFRAELTSEEAKQRIDEIMAKVEELDLMPQVAKRIMMVTKDKMATVSELEKAISFDQSLISKILQISNSSFYGLEREVKTLRKAIVVLGLKELRDIAISAALLNMYGRASEVAIKNWDFAVGSAISSKIISQELDELETEECFISGLLLNIGRVVLNKLYPEECSEIFKKFSEGKNSYWELEKESFGVDANHLGSSICYMWNFSPNIQNVVLYSNNVADCYSQNFEDMQKWNIAIANMATLFCQRLGIGFSAPNPNINIHESEANLVLNISMTRLEDIFETIKLAYYDNKCLFL